LNKDIHPSLEDLIKNAAKPMVPKIFGKGPKAASVPKQKKQTKA
jgi:hypothetical protein